MGAVLTLDAEQLKRDLAEFSKLTGKSCEDVVRQEMGSLARTVIRYTPPGTAAEGKAAVERDIRRLYTSPKDLFPGGVRNKRLADLIQRRQWEAAIAVIKNIPVFQHLRVADSVDRSYHESRRDARGRVRKQKPSILLKNPRQLADYIRQRQQRVGSAKAGWLSAVNRFGASAVSQWITKHGTAEGAITDALRDGGGYVEATTTNTGAVELDDRLGIVYRALGNTEKALSIRIQKTVEKMSAEFTAK